MIKILEAQHKIDNIHENQSRIVEWESFQEYCKSLLIGEAGIPEDANQYNKIVNWEHKEVYCLFDFLGTTFVHFAKVIEVTNE